MTGKGTIIIVQAYCVMITPIVPSTPPARARIVAEPAATPVTNPLTESTAASVGASDVQRTVVLTGTPLTSRAEAASCVDCPTRIVVGDPATVTLNTGSGSTVLPQPASAAKASSDSILRAVILDPARRESRLAVARSGAG